MKIFFQSTLLYILALFLTTTVTKGDTTAEAAEEPDTQKTEKTLFADGCFWCMEKLFELKRTPSAMPFIVPAQGVTPF